MAQKPATKQIFQNRRHTFEYDKQYKIGMLDIIITSQKYKFLDPRIRSCNNWIILFDQSENDLAMINDEMIGMQKKKWLEF